MIARHFRRRLTLGVALACVLLLPGAQLSNRKESCLRGGSDRYAGVRPLPLLPHPSGESGDRDAASSLDRRGSTAVRNYFGWLMVCSDERRNSSLDCSPCRNDGTSQRLLSKPIPG